MSDSAILSVDDMLVTYSDRISILKTSYLSQWQLSIRWQQLSNCCSTPAKYNHVCSDGFYSAKHTELPNHLKNLPKYTLVTKKNYQTYIGANCISPQMCVNSMYGIYLFQNCPYVCQYGYQYLCPWLAILLAIKLPTWPDILIDLIPPTEARHLETLVHTSARSARSPNLARWWDWMCKVRTALYN